MGASRIEQLIEDIYEFVESCRMQPLSSSKVIVPKDELYDLLDELRLRTPDEIKRYQKIISNRDAIISDAEEKAQTIIAEAKENANNMIDEHEIMQQAYAQAQSIVDQAGMEADNIVASANHDADTIRQGALNYATDMLGDVENILNNAFESTKTKFDNVLDCLKGNLDIVQNNLQEIAPPSPQEQQDAQLIRNDDASTEPVEENTTDDYNFDENTFLNGIDNE